MAEVTAGGHRGGWPPERDVLLATKLHVPHSRPGLVTRPRLADLLDEGADRGLVLVAAPAGYGKSVLLSQWARRRTQPVAWLSLDAGDNDPVRFWRHVLAAADLARAGIAERVGPLAGPPPPPVYDALVSALINDVVAEPGLPGVLLVFDDYQLITSPTVHASVRFLLEHRPPQLHVVLASRADPPLGLARFRGRGELGEVRAADLRFTVDEAAELLRQASADLDLSAAAALAERTEGWAVGLQLAALSLRGQPDVASGIRIVPGACIATPHAGMSSEGCPMRRSGTPWPRENRSGPPGWLKSTSTRCSTCVASKRPSRAGSRRCLRTSFVPAPGCCWPRRKWRACAAT